MAWRMKPTHVLYCDFADNSKSKYGSAFLVVEILLHYSRPFEKLPAWIMLKDSFVWGKLALADYNPVMFWF